jgi:hypothetical protein
MVTLCLCEAMSLRRLLVPGSGTLPMAYRLYNVSSPQQLSQPKNLSESLG